MNVQFKTELTNFNRVSEFHTVFGHPVHNAPASVGVDRIRLRLNLILEEVDELIDAVKRHHSYIPHNLDHASDCVKEAMSLISHADYGSFDLDHVKAADALTDILYVVYGAGLEFGLPLDECFKEVHESNMSKLGANGKPIYNPDTGKVMKGPNYRAPDLDKVINNQE